VWFPLILTGLVACTLAFAGESNGLPTTRYVDGHGRGGSCSDARSAATATSASTPWCSIARAIAAAPPGSLVVVRGGSYPSVEVSGDNRRTQPLTLRPHGGEAVTIHGLKIAASSFLRFEGFKFTDNVELREEARHIALVGNELPTKTVWLHRTADVLIARNHIHDVYSNTNGWRTIGIKSRNDVRLTIRRNRIEKLAEDPIQITKGHDVLIEGNTLRDAHPDDGQHTDAIQILGADRLTIRRNYAYNVRHGLMFTDHAAYNVTIENNVIARVRNMGMSAHAVGDKMPNLKLLNNTWHETRYGVNLRSGHPNAIVRNNIFDAVSDLEKQPTAEHNLIGKPASGAKYGTRAILKQPIYTDATSFELAARSPGVDAGTSIGTPSADRHGRARSDDPNSRNAGTGHVGYVDIGAHERQAGRIEVGASIRLGQARRGIRVRIWPAAGAPVARVELLHVGRRGAPRRLVRQSVLIRGSSAVVRLVAPRLSPGQYVVSARFRPRQQSFGQAITARLRVIP
jgi:hypothetical protein